MLDFLSESDIMVIVLVMLEIPFINQISFLKGHPYGKKV